jgi:hypoxanthine phosphoribosyltransferase
MTNQFTSIIHNSKMYSVKPLFTSQEISLRVQQLAGEISSQYSPSQTISVLVVLHGAFLFAADLVRQLTNPTEILSVRLKSYDGVNSTGQVTCEGTFPNLSGKAVLVIEDIVDTGKSMEFLLKALNEQKPASVRVASLLDKPGQYPPHLKPQHVGFSIGQNFVIGYGLDLDGQFRNLPYVAEMTHVDA